MNPLVIAAGVLAGLGVFTAVCQLVPGGPRLDAALARINASGSAAPPLTPMRALAARAAAAMPWLPLPAADLALLGQDTERWLATKIVCGLTGLATIPALSAVALAAGYPVSWAVPAVASFGIGIELFSAPNPVTSVHEGAKG
ncbi:MAG: hypothetical protein ACR2FU_10325, partial [Streptosporangiaceae bacterium]